MHMSLDGVVSDLEKWASIQDDTLYDSMERYDTVDTVLFGGNTFNPMAEYWKNAELNSSDPLEKDFAKQINSKKKFALINRDLHIDWNASEKLLYTSIEDLKSKLNELKAKEGKNISVESGIRTWHLFLENSLFDEIWLRIQPVIAGSGTRLFDSVKNKMNLEVVESKQFPSGILGVTYRRTKN